MKTKISYIDDCTGNREQTTCFQKRKTGGFAIWAPSGNACHVAILWLGGKNQNTLYEDSGGTTAGFFFGDNDLFVNAFFQLGNMGDDTHQTVALSQTCQGVVSLAQGF